MTPGVSQNTEEPPRLPVAVGLSTSPQSEESKGRERKGKGAFPEQEVCHDDVDESPIFTQPDHQLDTVPKVYQPNPIDPKDYPGTKSMWQRPVTVPARCPASKGQCPSMPASSGLFNGHNIPSPCNPYNEGQVEIWEGGNLIHIVKQRMFKRTVEGEKEGKTPKRGKITGFSRSSQRRMRIFMATLKLDGEELPQFVTLTYPDVKCTEFVGFEILLLVCGCWFISSFSLSKGGLAAVSFLPARGRGGKFLLFKFHRAFIPQ
jgi:hypothetical protein